MEIIAITDGVLRARVSALGGSIMDAYAGAEPILRPYAGDETVSDPLKAASFPMVPFGNRVEDNRFTFEGHQIVLAPNTQRDRHYVHGDGWLLPWTVLAHSHGSVTLAFNHSAREYATPYSYSARQEITIADGALHMMLSVTNAGEFALPFGLGHHLFLPLTDRTMLLAPATGFWSEKHDYLPDRLSPIPLDLDFRVPRRLPSYWINSGFEGWAGTAAVVWPERKLTLQIEGEPPFDRYFLFRSALDFDSEFRDDYFCFEPMTHSANGHNLGSASGLRRLAPGQTMTTQLRLRALAMP